VIYCDLTFEQIPVMWLFLLEAYLVLISFTFLLPYFGSVSANVTSTRVALNVLATLPILLGFVVDLFVQGPRAFFSSWANWLEFSLLLPGLIGSLLVESVFKDYCNSGFLLMGATIAVVSGFLVRFYVTIGSRLNFTPLKTGDKSRLRSVTFIWVNRDVEGMDWLLDELRQLEAQDTRGLFNIKLFLTQQKRIPSNLGLRNLPHFGRPDWPTVLLQLACDTPVGTVIGVFFCGPAGMARAVRLAAATATAASLELSEDCTTLIARTRFLFRKEIF